MLQNAGVTAFIVSELLRENQQGGGGWEWGWVGGKIIPTPTPMHIRVKKSTKEPIQVVRELTDTNPNKNKIFMNISITRNSKDFKNST